MWSCLVQPWTDIWLLCWSRALPVPLAAYTNPFQGRQAMLLVDLIRTSGLMESISLTISTKRTRGCVCHKLMTELPQLVRLEMLLLQGTPHLCAETSTKPTYPSCSRTCEGLAWLPKWISGTKNLIQLTNLGGRITLWSIGPGMCSCYWLWSEQCVCFTLSKHGLCVKQMCATHVPTCSANLVRLFPSRCVWHCAAYINCVSMVQCEGGLQWSSSECVRVHVLKLGQTNIRLPGMSWQGWVGKGSHCPFPPFSSWGYYNWPCHPSPESAGSLWSQRYHPSLLTLPLLLQVPQGEWNNTLSRDKDSEIPCRRMRSGSYIKAMGDDDSGDSDTSPKPSPKIAARRESYLKATQPSLTELTTLK